MTWALRYAAHGESSSFLVSLLDRYVGEGRELSLEAALEVLQKCYGELEDRYLVNTGGALQVKVVDRHGCRSLPDIRRRPAKP
jgi:20S proteasome alpha/beta subunit